MMYESPSTKVKRGCLDPIEPLSKRHCSYPQRHSSEEELEEGEYKETPVASPHKSSKEGSPNFALPEANGTSGSNQLARVSGSHSGHEATVQHCHDSQGASLEAGEVSAGDLDLFLDHDDVTSLGSEARRRDQESMACEAMDVDQLSGRMVPSEEKCTEPPVDENHGLEESSWDEGPGNAEELEGIGLKRKLTGENQGIVVREDFKHDNGKGGNDDVCQERDCLDDNGRVSEKDRLQSRSYVGKLQASRVQMGVSVKSSNVQFDNMDSAEPGRSGVVLDTIVHRNNGQYGGSGGTSDELDYDSGDVDREDSLKLEEVSTEQKGDFSDPFSDIDDSLINVDEEMESCTVPSRVQASLPKVEPGMAGPEMELIDSMSPRGMSDDEPPNESVPQGCGAELSNLTSLLSGDRTLGMDGVMVNSGEHQDANISSEPGPDAFPQLQHNQYTEDVVAGAGTLEHSEEGAVDEIDYLADEDGSQLLLERPDQKESILNGLLPHYSSLDLHDKVISRRMSGDSRVNKSGQVFSLLAEYKDDDDDDDDVEGNSDEEKEDEHREDVQPQNALNADEAPHIMPEETEVLAKEHKKGNDCKSGDEAVRDSSAAQTKYNPPDLPPHLKMLSKPTTPADLAREDGTTSPKNLERLKKLDGSDCEQNNDGEKNVCEDLEALLPEEYKDRAEGEVSPSIQETIRNLLEFQQTQNIFFNDEVMANKQFRNPCFLTKMSVHFGIDEFGTELNQNIYNPHNLPREDYADGIRAERYRRASTSQVSAPAAGGTGSSRVMGPPSAPPGVQNAILQGQRRLREKFTSMAAGKTRPSKWDTGQ